MHAVSVHGSYFYIQEGHWPVLSQSARYPLRGKKSKFNRSIRCFSNAQTLKNMLEATTSKIGEDQIFYCNQRGIATEDAVALIVNGYAKEVLNQLPMEFAVEAQKLLALTLEGSVG